jgi:hypothetical protein
LLLQAPRDVQRDQFLQQSQRHPQPPYRLTQTGYTIGGPVHSGRFNRSRDKLFFFMSGSGCARRAR